MEVPQIPPEVLAEYVDDECPTCGAWVLNVPLHAQWHIDIKTRADRYVDPPRYGGHR